MAIYLHNEDPRYELKGKRNRIKRWIRSILEQEYKKPGDINLILTNDDQLLEINRSFLNRDDYTDVIAFEYAAEPLSGDIYISAERVEENAEKFGNKLEEEVLRVMAHGILHLCGYKDKDKEERMLMRTKEESYLKEWEK